MPNIKQFWFLQFCSMFESQITKCILYFSFCLWWLWVCKFKELILFLLNDKVDVKDLCLYFVRIRNFTMPSTLEAEAGRLQVQAQPGPHWRSLTSPPHSTSLHMLWSVFHPLPCKIDNCYSHSGIWQMFSQKSRNKSRYPILMPDFSFPPIQNLIGMRNLAHTF